MSHEDIFLILGSTRLTSTVFWMGGGGGMGNGALNYQRPMSPENNSLDLDSFRCPGSCVTRPKQHPLCRWLGCKIASGKDCNITWNSISFLSALGVIGQYVEVEARARLEILNITKRFNYVVGLMLVAAEFVPSCRRETLCGSRTPSIPGSALSLGSASGGFLSFSVPL